MLAGLLAPTEGKIFFDGTDIYSLDDAALSTLRNRSIGVIPQGQTGLHSLTVLTIYPLCSAGFASPDTHFPRESDKAFCLSLY